MSTVNLIRQLHLSECFHEYVPSELKDFNCGYMEGRGAAKRWIISVEDNDTMYESFFEGQVIMLRCGMKMYHLGRQIVMRILE